MRSRVDRVERTLERRVTCGADSRRGRGDNNNRTDREVIGNVAEIIGTVLQMQRRCQRVAADETRGGCEGDGLSACPAVRRYDPVVARCSRTGDAACRLKSANQI